MWLLKEMIKKRTRKLIWGMFVKSFKWPSGKSFYVVTLSRNVVT